MPNARELEAIFDALPDAAVVIDQGRLVAMNAAFAELSGQRSAAGDVGRVRLSQLLVEDLSGFFERLPGAHAAGEVLRLHLRRAERVVPVDVRVGRTDGGAWVLVGRDATAEERIGALVGELSSLYERQGPPFETVAALVGQSRPVLEALGWNVGIWRVEASALHWEAAWLTDQAREHETGLGAFLVEKLREFTIPLDIAPLLAATVRDRKGQALEGIPEILERLSTSTPLVLPGLTREAFVGSGFVRGATAPVMVAGRVSHVVAVIGAAMEERDFAGTQLFASMLSAVLRMNELGTQMARQQRHAALGQMSRQLAHEVRNPLAVILQATRQARKDDGERGRMLDMIDEEADRLRRLVDDLVSFADPGDARLSPTPLGPLVRWSYEALCADERRPVDIAIDDSVVALADPVLLRQALTHLLSNACSHARDHVRVAASREGERVWLRVENDGEPMPAQVADRVFEPFFSTRPTGCGLGLAVVRRLIEDQGGRVSLDAGGDAITFVVELHSA